VIALLSALNANLYGASRMIYSLAERGEAPRLLARLSARQVPVLAVFSCVLFGFIATALELIYPQRVLPLLLSVVGSTCLVVWTSSLVSQLILRRRANRLGTPLPYRMRGFPFLTVLALTILGAIFALLLASPETRFQLLAILVLIAVIAIISEARRRMGSQSAPS
jgi:AAT family amino acid transporter